MLSGYECSIFGYEGSGLDSHSIQFLDGSVNPINPENLDQLPSEVLLKNAWTFARARDTVEAKRLAECVLEKESDSLVSADAHVLIANLATEVYSFEEAESHFFKAASICRSLGSDNGLGISLQNLASLVYFTQGQVDLAMSIMEESNFHLIKAGARAWGYPLLNAYLFEAFGDRPKLTKALDDLILQVEPGSYAAGVYFLTWAKVCLDDNETAESG